MRVTLWLNPEVNLTYASYYIAGLIQLAKAGKIGLRVRVGLPQGWCIDLSKVHRASELFQFYMLLEVKNKSTKYRLALSLHDWYADIDPYILERVDILYKSNYNADWILDNMADTQADKIRPAGLFFPLPLPTFFDLLLHCNLDWMSVWLLKKRGWLLNYRVSLDQMRVWRALPPTRDIFFNCSAWANPEKRNELISRIKKIPLEFYGGFIPTERAKENYPENTQAQPIAHRDYIYNLATSRITINTRGKHECFAWKLPEQLALGKFVLSERLVNTCPYELEDGVHVVFLQEGFADLEEKIIYYLEHPGEREEIATNGRRFFDEYIAPEQICWRLLSEF